MCKPASLFLAHSCVINPPIHGSWHDAVTPSPAAVPGGGTQLAWFLSLWIIPRISLCVDLYLQDKFYSRPKNRTASFAKCHLVLQNEGMSIFVSLSILRVIVLQSTCQRDRLEGIFVSPAFEVIHYLMLIVFCLPLPFLLVWPPASSQRNYFYLT